MVGQKSASGKLEASMALADDCGQAVGNPEPIRDLPESVPRNALLVTRAARTIMLFAAATGGRSHGEEQTQARSEDGLETARS